MEWQNYQSGYATLEIENAEWQKAKTLTIKDAQPEHPKDHAINNQHNASIEKPHYICEGCEEVSDEWQEAYPNSTKVWCIACHIELNGPIQWNDHKKSKRHSNGIRIALKNGRSKGVHELERHHKSTEASEWLDAGRRDKHKSTRAKRRGRRKERKKKEAQEALETALADATKATNAVSC